MGQLVKKIVTIILLTLAACLLAGTYGILHDQLTYTISPEYYTKFKFYQFELLDEGMPGPLPNPRLWVCYIGFMATWWLGIPIGIILGSISTCKDIRTMIDIALKSFLVVLIFQKFGSFCKTYISFFFRLHHNNKVICISNQLIFIVDHVRIERFQVDVGE